MMIKNPVMFTVEIGTSLCWVFASGSMTLENHSQGALLVQHYSFLLSCLLTVLFANFAEAIAEARGKAQAEVLRKTREDTPAKKYLPLVKCM